MTNDQITITVKFFANLREFGPPKEEITIPKGSSINDVLDKYNIPKDKRNLIFIINSRPHKKLNAVLENGDILAIFPIIAGGAF